MKRWELSTAQQAQLSRTSATGSSQQQTRPKLLLGPSKQSIAHCTASAQPLKRLGPACATAQMMHGQVGKCSKGLHEVIILQMMAAAIADNLETVQRSTARSS